jgi:hypothetical protein
VSHARAFARILPNPQLNRRPHSPVPAPAFPAAAASNLIFVPPLPHLLTPLVRLRLNSAAPFHGPSQPWPSLPVPTLTRHTSLATLSSPSALSTYLSYRTVQPPCYPYYTPPALYTDSLHLHFSPFIHFAPSCPHLLRLPSLHHLRVHPLSPTEQIHPTHRINPLIRNRKVHCKFQGIEASRASANGAKETRKTRKRAQTALSPRVRRESNSTGD